MIEEEDRISRLPDELIHHILSFVNTRYAVRTCVLSKRWIHVWKSLPFLIFDIYGSCIGYVDTSKHSDFIDKVLQLRYDCSIQSFKLTWASQDLSISSVNKLIDAAVKHNVQEVAIELFQYGEGFRYEMSPELLNCKSLKKLTLRASCDEPYQYAEVSLPKSISLPQLQFMYIQGFLVEDVESTKKLFSSCPVLETLEIVDCDIQTNQWNFTVDSLSLKQFTYVYRHGSGGLLYKAYGHGSGGVRYNYKPLIRLSAPSLKHFTCKSDWKHEYYLQNCFDELSDVKLNILYHFEYDYQQLEEKEVYAGRMVKLLVAVNKVQRLDLSPGFLELLSSANDLVNTQLPCLCNLQSLRLETWLTRRSLHSIVCLLAISPNIKTLILIQNPDGITWNKMQPGCSSDRGLLDSNLVDIGDDWEVGLSLPGMLSELKVVQIENAEGCGAELKILSFLLKNAKGLEEIALCPCSTVDSIPRLRKKYKDKLREIARASPCIKMRWVAKESTRT